MGFSVVCGCFLGVVLRTQSFSGGSATLAAAHGGSDQGQKQQVLSGVDGKQQIVWHGPKRHVV